MSRARIGYGPPAADKRLGALPVVAEFARRLDIAGIVDRACPVRDLALLSHGQVIEALVANRLTSPAPLVHVEDWAREWAVGEIFGIDPGALNDDRSAGPWTRSPRSWKASSVRSGRLRSPRSAWTWPGCIGT